jgi:hypothetical protein
MSLSCVSRYGQEEIENMLRGRGALEAVQVERKVSTAGESKDWLK